MCTRTGKFGGHHWVWVQHDISRGDTFLGHYFGTSSAHVHLHVHVHPPNIIHVFGGCPSMKVQSVYMYLLLPIPDLVGNHFITCSGNPVCTCSHWLPLPLAASTAGCAIKYILGHRSPAPPLSLYLDRYWHIQGDKNGRLYLWDIRKVNNTTPLSPSGTPSQISTLPESSACIADSWEHPAMPCGLTDKLVWTVDCEIFSQWKLNILCMLISITDSN